MSEETNLEDVKTEKSAKVEEQTFNIDINGRGGKIFKFSGTECSGLEKEEAVYGLLKHLVVVNFRERLIQEAKELDKK